MSDGERKLLDASGDYRYAVRDGEAVGEAPWQSCRVVLTTERLVLATGSDERSIPLGRVRVPADLPEGTPTDGATPVGIGETVLLIDVQGREGLGPAHARATLHDEVVLVDHPRDADGDVAGADADAAGGGGEPDGDEVSGWTKARVDFGDDRLALGLRGGATVGFALADVADVRRATGEVQGRERPILAVAHGDEAGGSGRTRLSGADEHVRALERVLRAAPEPDPVAELSNLEREVLVALYSGVPALDVPAFVGADAAEVEAVYERLVDVGAAEVDREGTEVVLSDRGRNLASRAMGAG